MEAHSRSLVPVQNASDSSMILREVVKHLDEEFIPVRSAIANLESYDLMSIQKIHRESKQEAGPGIDLTDYSCTDEKKEDLVRRLLFPADVFDATGPAVADTRPKKVGEGGSMLAGNINFSEWKTDRLPLGAGNWLSLKWKTDVTSPSIDLGAIYESKVKRADIRKWLVQNEDHFNQEDLKQLARTHDLYIVCHVLYCEKIVITPGTESGEKTLAVGTFSMSSTYQRRCTEDVKIIRSSDAGIKPIAFKITKLNVVRRSWFSSDVKLELAPQGW